MGGGAPPPQVSRPGVSARSIRIHPAALEEAEAAVDWYGRRSVRAPQLFLDEVDRALSGLQIIRNSSQSMYWEAEG
jgi:hypothetical protein